MATEIQTVGLRKTPSYCLYLAPGHLTNVLFIVPVSVPPPDLAKLQPHGSPQKVVQWGSTVGAHDLEILPEYTQRSDPIFGVDEVFVFKELDCSHWDLLPGGLAGRGLSAVAIRLAVTSSSMEITMETESSLATTPW